MFLPVSKHFTVVPDERAFKTQAPDILISLNLGIGVKL
jgi:hypothetical protein